MPRKKQRNKWCNFSMFTHLLSLRISLKSPGVHFELLCKGFRTSDLQRKEMSGCAELIPLVSLLFGHS